MVEITLPSVESLPEDCEATTDLQVEQIQYLKKANDESQAPFEEIQKPEGVDSLSFLPPGFSTQTSDRSVVRLGWAPHQEILAHRAIGGCLFHSGWGSIIESLGFGQPPIIMPMIGDQSLNAKLLMEKGVGYEVPRNEDGSFNQDAVAESIRLVMVEQEGEPLQAKAAQMQNVFFHTRICMTSM
ncbi:UDP-glycosyltransferase 91D1-like [Camellia sinensis]|uniref:UDP-glycosyltransferase 91D1-like n=1 Tax=Camellia sinensis TaxID=4442 RepID=UPI001035BE4E|nr:UDP-glycosyltransferase 91D1-like [Camellia sinensis]